jgi:hypothetical protein
MPRNVVAQSQNMVIWSEDLSNAAWLKSPAGLAKTTTRITDTNDGAPTSHYIYQTHALPTIKIGENFSIRMSVKPGTLTWFSIALPGGYISAYYQLTGNGVLGTITGAGVTASIIPDPDYAGWYLCTLVGKVITQLMDYMILYTSKANASVSYQGDGTGTLEITRIQVSQADRVCPYTKTTTTALTSGVRSLVAQAQNLVLYSEDLTYGGLTNATTPAWNTLQDVGGGSLNHLISITVSQILQIGQNFTLAASVKNGTKSWILLAVGGYNCYFNVATGTIGTQTGGPCTPSISADPDNPGYFLCQITGITPAILNGIFIYLANGDTLVTYAGDGTGTILVAKIHLTNSNRLGPYIKTNNTYVTTPLRNSIPQTQNLIKYSETFDNAIWVPYTAGSATVATTVETLDPIGGNGAYKITATGAGNIYHSLNQPYTITLALSPLPRTLTLSVYVKAGTGRYAVIGTALHTAWYRTWFDFNTNSISGNDPNVTGSFVSIGNGWYRIFATFTVPVGTSSPTIEDILISTATTNLALTFTQSSETIYVYGAQANQGSYATPYIKTTTTGTLVNNVGRNTPTNNMILDLQGDIGVILSESKVTKWVDQTNRGNDVYQNNDALRPTLGPLWNGKQTLQFADTLYMSNTNRPDLIPTTTFTILTVIQIDTEAPIQFILGRGNTANQGYWLGAFSRQPTADVGNNVMNVRPQNTAIALATPTILGITYDGYTVTSWSNAVASAPLTIANPASYIGIPDFIVGQITGLVAGRYWQGPIAAIRMWSNCLTPQEILTESRVLGAKWGITI